MLKYILSKIFGSQNERYLKSLKPIIDKINSYERELEQLSDEDLRKKTFEFKQRLKDGETLDDILPEAFAVVREASKRTIKLRHFDVQLIGGIVLHQGKIAEMKTGEGKTLVATLAAYLNALEGKGVHIVTVNDYLAKRDRYWMGPIYEFLGCSVGYIEHDMPPEVRRQMYACDITYVTNNEVGFDYLRDNMVLRKEDKVLRGLHYAIVDEVDSILIDEARTPLIISGPAEESTEKYYIANKIVPRLNIKIILEEEEIEAKYKGINIYKGYDAIVDEKNHTVVLTDEGIKKCEKLLNISNIYDDLTSDWVHIITQAIRAHKLFHRDVHYVVKDGEIVIVDEFTGRLMPGRRWSDGLHQAIEAKENLPIREENQTLATITFQNFFRMYKKLAGMTGTALTSADEFWGVYKLDVVVIPTHKPMIRIDHPDVVYRTEKEKWKAIVDDIERHYRKQQPVLVGTRSIEKNEFLSSLLRRRGIPHQVLNAKHHEREAQIIAQAGKLKAVTVATNMAGRGVDIILGGKPDIENAPHLICNDPNCKVEFLHNNEYHEVVKLGGLYVLGTERHEARRIDDQLRGRSGRQGDPGESRFYVSLEDELMRLFGGIKMSEIMLKLGMKEGESIQHPWITKSIEKAQKRVESMNYEIRKQLLEYDDVMNKQREAVYSLRDAILEGKDLEERILNMLEESVEDKIESFCSAKYPEEWNWAAINLWLTRVFGISLQLGEDQIKKYTKEKLKQEILSLVKEKYNQRKEELTDEVFFELQRIVFLNMLDVAWRENLYELDHLKRSVGLRAYGQRDPIVEYKKESYILFTNMQTRIREQTIEYIFKLQPVITSKLTQKNMKSSKVVNFESKSNDKNLTKKVKIEKIGRNDPCPCGSGKKYKKCCGKSV
ncbi:MAG: preprotein translocase subunit SecA [Elusimicrobiota bacterium]|nr:preprotein translocase subunit SecA [Endomicrobiia bacterium]MDW8165191.1 preprotein translocase subunit SecA [Elusimicrobiota bacterium]